jgi:hypothetical protein
MHSLIVPLVSLFAAYSAIAQSTTVPVEEIVRVQPIEGVPDIPRPIVKPKPGAYVGVLTIHKILLADGLRSKVTLKAHASVKSSGDLAIIAVVPESPLVAADNPESTVSRGVLQADGSYLMDGKHRAFLSVFGDTFQLAINTPPPTIKEPVLINAPMVVGYVPPIDLSQSPPQTQIHYRFVPSTSPSVRRSR